MGKQVLLIVDKKGIIGATLVSQLQEKFTIVLVTAGESPTHKNVIHIPYRKKIPRIPDHLYSHMFLVYNGESELIDMLPTFVAKSQEMASKVLFITSFLHCSASLTRKLNNHLFKSVTVLVYGELFDNRGLEVNLINNFIHQARTKRRIDIPNTGLGKHHPVYLDDVLTAIIATAFSAEKKANAQLLFPKHSVSEISLARILQKMDPLLKIDFKKQKNRSTGFSLPEGEYLFAHYNVEERLRMIDLDPNTAPLPLSSSSMLTPSNQRGTNIWLIGGLLIFGLTFIPMFLTVLFSLFGAGFLTMSLKATEQTNISIAETTATAAQSSFIAATTLEDSMVLANLFLPGPTKTLTQNVESGAQLAETQVNVLNAVKTLQDIYAGKSKNPRNDFLHALASVKNSLLVLQKMKAEGHLPKAISTKLSSLDETITLFANTSDTLPNILGFEGKKRYLVLFQNNMELRPGGGFIGSYAILEMDKAKMTYFKVYDIYDADGKLKEHIEPPYGLRRYLGVRHWFMRDSNFNIDFPKNAEQEIAFLKKETGETVDGVIAMDTSFLKSVISALGEIKVIDYNETVTADNFYMLTQNHAEKDFFPGSTQKKDFIRSLAESIMARLEDRKDVPYALLIQKVGESIKEKHLMIAVPDKAMQSVFTVNNMSAAVWDGRSESENTFLDYLGVVDANIGVNKGNYYLKRSITQNASIDDKGDMLTTTSVMYENTSSKNSPFGGDYRDYARFILPKGSVLQSVRIDDSMLSVVPAITDPNVFTQAGFIAPSGLEVEQTEQNGKTIIGFFFIVPTNATKKVSITYTLPGVIDSDKSSFAYRLRLFKQPGTDKDPYSLIFTYPTSYTPVNGDDEFTDVGGKMTYSTLLSHDKDIQASFSKK